MDKIALLNRTRAFAVKVFKLVDDFPKSKASDVVAYQLLKSASSVAANYRAANRAKSKADFISKLGTVLEEADESNFWLNFISETELLKANKDLDFLADESNQLCAIFVSALKTLKSSKS